MAEYFLRRSSAELIVRVHTMNSVERDAWVAFASVKKFLETKKQG